jgi:predicted branched-subunit amino acid permease
LTVRRSTSGALTGWAERDIVLAAFSMGFTIAVYGVVFGVLAGPAWGSWTAILGSALISSGSIQFTAAELIAQGSSAGAVVASAAILNTRHVFLGAVLRSRVRGGLARRAGMAFFMDDESFGLGVASARSAAKVVLGAGVIFFVAWVGGTALGAFAGGGSVLLADAASAMFPVLFVGMAAITVEDRAGVARTLAAGIGALALVYALPGVRDFVPVAAALVIAFVGARR